MVNSVTTNTVAKNFAKVSDFPLTKSALARLIFRGQIHLGGIRGTIIRLRRDHKTDKWEEGRTVNIRELQPGQGVNIELDTEAVHELRIIFAQLDSVLKQGIQPGRTEFITAKAGEVIVPGSDNVKYLDELLRQGHSAEIWKTLVETDADLATKLAWGQIYINREKVLDEYSFAMKDPSKKEKWWQGFFAQNEWIFGFGLDYKFLGILQKEFHASNTQADGSNAVIADYLLGDERFTTFVEVKRPNTPLFGRDQTRSNCWRLSNDLMEAVSQILEQKASGQLKLAIEDLYNTHKKKIHQEAYDTKVVLVIGCWDELENINEQEKQIKEKTFELFRRDSRNIEIITYDELYDRAKHIVSHKKLSM